MRILIFILSLNVLSLISCRQSPSESNLLKEEIVELKTESGYDFSSLKEAIGSKRIVALGESTHGSGSFFRLKSELVKYLHEEMGFEVLAMESGLGDTFLAYNDVESITSEELRDKSVFGNFRAEEADLLFQHVKISSNSDFPLEYVGFDSQTSTDTLISWVQQVLLDYDESLSDSLNVFMQSYFKSHQAGQQGDSIGFCVHRDVFLRATLSAKTIFSENTNSIQEKWKIDPLQFEIAVRSLEMLYRSFNVSFENRYQVYALRDELMAENLVWLMEEIHPGKKFVVWAHNAHVENENYSPTSPKWMGHWLKERYQDNYFSIGITSYKGEAYQFWTDEVITYENNDSLSIESRFFETGIETAFLDMSNIINDKRTSWVYAPMTSFELENGGEITFIPKNRFDAIISLSKSDPPTFE